MQKTQELNMMLYEKMRAEQEVYREWLLNQTPAEILNHTYEYTMREDIVIAMQELDLAEKQAKALIKSPCPLEDVFKEYNKAETDHMDNISETIKARANYVLREDFERNIREGR